MTSIESRVRLPTVTIRYGSITSALGQKRSQMEGAPGSVRGPGVGESRHQYCGHRGVCGGGHGIDAVQQQVADALRPFLCPVRLHRKQVVLKPTLPSMEESNSLLTGNRDLPLRRVTRRPHHGRLYLEQRAGMQRTHAALMPIIMKAEVQLDTIARTLFWLQNAERRGGWAKGRSSHAPERAWSWTPPL